MTALDVLIPHHFHTTDPLHGLSCYLNAELCSASNTSVVLVQLSFHPVFPTVFPGTPGILINLYILSTFLLQLLGGNEGTDCSKFLYGLLVFSTGRGGSGSGVGRGHKGEKRREKTGAVSNEVVGHA